MISAIGIEIRRARVCTEVINRLLFVQIGCAGHDSQRARTTTFEPSRSKKAVGDARLKEWANADSVLCALLVGPEEFDNAGKERRKIVHTRLQDALDAATAHNLPELEEMSVERAKSACRRILNKSSTSKVDAAEEPEWELVPIRKKVIPVPDKHA